MMEIENIVSGAREGSWEWFKQLDPAISDLLEVKKAKSDEDRKAIAGAWADFYKRPEGRKALEFLFNTTLRRTVFFAQLGLTAEQVGLWGSFREGQNAVAHEIARQIAAGLGEEGPKPRDI